MSAFLRDRGVRCLVQHSAQVFIAFRLVDLESPFAGRSRQLDGTANSPEETHQNGHKSHFSSEA